jgi:hypothetical protein
MVVICRNRKTVELRKLFAVNVCHEDYGAVSAVMTKQQCGHCSGYATIMRVYG